MSLPTLLWLFPIVFMLHDFEEIIRFKTFLSANGDALAKRVPKPVRREFANLQKYTTAQYSLAIAIEFLIFSLVTLHAVESGWYPLFIFFAVGHGAHGLYHVASGLVLRQPIPGAVTALLLVLPYSAYLCLRLTAEGYTTWGTIGWLVPVSLVFFMAWMKGLFWVVERVLGRR
jgi:hypothetical protein